MSRLQKSLVFVGVALLVFSLSRMALYVMYYEQFSTLDAAAVYGAFIRGVKFDLSIILTFFGLPLLMMNLPIRYAEHKIWLGGWGLTLYLLVVVATLLLIGDIIYYAEVKRHMGRELLSLSNDWEFIVSMAIGPHKFVLVAFFVYAAGLLVLWIRILAAKQLPVRRPLVKFVFLVFFLVLGVRGGIEGKPINVIDAFSSGNVISGNLVLNGVFTTFHASRKSGNANHHHFQDDELREILGIKDAEFPLVRRYMGEPKGYNLVFVLLESWDFDYIDSFSGDDRGLTPNFDALARDGIRFANFFAAGQRSIHAIQATLTGIPVLKGMPYLGNGLEVSNFSKLGEMARNNGYRTVFLQSSRRSSYRVDTIASATGFEEFYGMEDMPVLLDYPDPGGSKFGWDYETYMLLREALRDGVEQPFLAYLFTGSTHPPFGKLPGIFERHPHEPGGEGGYLNALHYSDWSLGEFMRFAEQQPWFDRTIFMFCSDHATKYGNKDNFLNRFRIPFVIYAPKIFESKIETTTGSQLDIMPTIIDILGFSDEFSALGESIFRKREGAAMVNGGEIMGLATDYGYVAHTLEHRVEAAGFGSNASPEYFDQLERRLLALDQLSFQLLQSNRWAR